MKIKRKQFNQHLEHDIEDEDKAWDHICDSLPKIGMIVMYFNSLEKMLDGMLCEMFSDRSDSTGLIVLQNMQYVAKVNLFGRFSDELHRLTDETPQPYIGLLEKLRDAAKQRNIVVHADWENMDDEGYAFSNIRFSDGGMEQVYVQLTPNALEAILETIQDARIRLSDYAEAKDDMNQRQHFRRFSAPS